MKENGVTDKYQREQDYCENRLVLQTNEKGVQIHAGKTFVYIGEMDAETAKRDFPGCLRSRCCEKKTRM